MSVDLSEEIVCVHRLNAFFCANEGKINLALDFFSVQFS